MKIGVMFGNPETTTGGNALKFYASVRLDIRRIGAIKQAEKAIGNRTKVKVVKNKLAPPFREVEFDIMYGEGISQGGRPPRPRPAEANVVEKSGAWFACKGERIGQGRENAKEFLKTNPRRGDADRARGAGEARHPTRGRRAGGAGGGDVAASRHRRRRRRMARSAPAKKSAKVPIDTPRA